MAAYHGYPIKRVDDFLSFDHGLKRMGLGSIGSTCDLVTSPIRGNMARSMECATSLKGSTFTTRTFDIHADADTYYYASFWLRWDCNAFPDVVGTYTIWNADDGGSTNCWYIQLADGTNSHTLKLYDGSGTLLATSPTDPFEEDTWYFCQMWWQHKNSGTFVFLKDNSIMWLVNSVDLDDGGTSGITWTFGTQRVAPFAGQATAYFSQMLFLAGLDGVNLPLDDDYDIFTYRPGESGSTGDCDSSGGTPGGTLDSGAFEDASDFDTGTECTYIGTNSGAVRTDDTNTYGDPGPSGSSDFDENAAVVAGKWSYNFDNSSTTITANVIYGYYDNTIHNVTSVDTGGVRNNNVYSEMVLWGQRPERVPNYDEYFVIGLHADGFYTMDMREWTCEILVIPGPSIGIGDNTIVRAHSARFHLARFGKQ